MSNPFDTAMPDLKKFLRERNEALLSLDLEYAGRMTGSRDKIILLLALHKSRYECVQLPDEPRLESARWLRERGYHRMQGNLPLLPEGELPK